MKLAFSFFLLGLSFGVGPCFATCGPLLISYMAGNSKNMAQSLKGYFLFSLSRLAVYLLLTIAVFSLGRFAVERFMQTHAFYFSLAGGIFIIVLGILMLLGKELSPRWCHRIQHTFTEKDSKNFIFLGVFTGLLPCFPLLGMLSYVTLVSRSLVNSVLYGFSFGMGTIISPLLLLVAFTGLLSKFIKGETPFRFFRILCGLVMIYLGIDLLRRGF